MFVYKLKKKFQKLPKNIQSVDFMKKLLYLRSKNKKALWKAFKNLKIS